MTFFSARIWAQEAGNVNNEAQLLAGPLISATSGVNDVIPLGGLGFGFLSRGSGVETQLLMGQGHGVSYSLISMDYRADIPMSGVNFFVLVGAHFDRYKPKDSTPQAGPPITTGGFEIGGGLYVPVSQALLARSDFRYRHGPGNSILVLLALEYRFAGISLRGGGGG